MKTALCLIKQCAVKTCGGEEVRLNVALLLAMDGPEWQHHVPTVLPLARELPVL